jgi:hypothetical protein
MQSRLTWYGILSCAVQAPNIARIVQHDGINAIFATVSEFPQSAELVEECIANIDIIARSSTGNAPSPSHALRAFAHA